MGKFTYEDKILQDDFYDFLPKLEEDKKVTKVWRTLIGEVHLSVKDKFDEVANTHVPLKGLQFF